MILYEPSFLLWAANNATVFNSSFSAGTMKRARRVFLPSKHMAPLAQALCFETWSEIEQENPLNLSISISGGKETNKDSPSNGE